MAGMDKAPASKPSVIPMAPPRPLPTMADAPAVLPAIEVGAKSPTLDDGRIDMSGQYNTRLSAADESKFQGWAKKEGRQGDLADYDLRGFWKSGAAFAKNGHGSDEWKKPNHPTFSTGSRYHGVDGHAGGRVEAHREYVGVSRLPHEFGQHGFRWHEEILRPR